MALTGKYLNPGSERMSLVQVRVLGDHVFGPAHLRLSEKQQLLLVLLAGSEEPLPRAFAARLLWPEASEARARHSLSQCIYSFRRLGIDRILITDGSFVSYSALAEVDARDFLGAIRAGDAAEAAGLYLGPFGSRVGPFHDEFDEWIDQTRTNFHRRARSACMQLRDSLRPYEFIGLADTLLVADPLDEELRQAKIDLLLGLRRFDEALAFFRNTRLIWEEELGESWPHPEPEVDDPPPDATSPFSRNVKFVGRRAEMAQLLSFWQGTGSRGMKRILLKGEPGVGKTSLAERFCRLLALRNGRSLWASAHPMEKNIPLGIVAQWLQRLGADVQLPLGDLTDVRATEMPPEYEMISVGRQRLYSRVASEIIRPGQPLCLVLDDIQWSDDASLGFLVYLARHFSSHPLLLLGTLRHTDIPRAVAEGVRDFHVIRIEPLARDEVTEFIHKNWLANSETDVDELSTTIHGRTGGNPLLLSALLTDGFRSNTSMASVPSSIMDFVQPRLERLSTTARIVLAALAILDRASLETLAAVAQSGHGTGNAVAELIATGLIADGGEGLRPRHGIIAEVALKTIGPAIERQLRGRAARVLQSDRATSPATLAVQYDLAGQQSKAYDAALRAAEASVELFAHQEAEYFFKVALANAPNVSAEARVRIQLADVFLARGQNLNAANILQDLPNRGISPEVQSEILAHQMVVRLIGSQDSGVIREAKHLLSSFPQSVSPDLHARLAMAFASSAHGQGNQDAVAEGVELALKLVPSLPLSPASLRIRMRLGILVAMYQSAKDGIALIEPTIEEASEWPDTLALGYAAIGSARVAAGESGIAERDLLRSLELMESTGSYDPKFMAVNNLGVLYQEQGRFQEAQALFESGLESRSEREVPAWAQVTLDNLVILAFEMGEWQHAIERADFVLQHFGPDRLSTRSWFAENSIKGLCCLELGERSRARECRREIELAYRRLAYASNDVSYVEIFFARMAEIEGKEEEAIQRLEHVARAFWPRDFFCAARMEVERLRLMLPKQREMVAELGVRLRPRLAAAGARPLVERLDSIAARAAALT